MELELLLATEGGEPVLEGLELDGLAPVPRPGDGMDKAGHLGDTTRDPDNLSAQRWGIIVPEGPQGDRLLELVAPLRAHREQEQGAAARVYRMPPGLDAKATLRWHKKVYAPENVPTKEVPRYLLMVGGLEQLSTESQKWLSVDTFCGRLAFSGESQYEAYVDKLLRWEKTGHTSDIPVRFHTVHDGTSAVSMAYRHLVKPLLDSLGKEGVSAVEEGDLFEPDPQMLLESARKEAEVLVAVSHGQGRPRTGWSLEQQLSQQGSMVFGGGSVLGASDVATGAFLPGGVLCSLACFGMGTPGISGYAPWLQRMAESGGAPVKQVLSSMPPAGHPGFLAALPQAALANPDGPLAVIGHLDLTWTYAFRDPGTGTSRSSRFHELLSALCARRRVGLGLSTLLSHFGRTNLALTLDYEREEEGQVLGRPVTVDPLQRLQLWMERQDLASYLLLGDPAARLPGPRSTPAPAVVELRTSDPATEREELPDDHQSQAAKAMATADVPGEPGAAGSDRPAGPPPIEAWLKEIIVMRATQGGPVQIEEWWDGQKGRRRVKLG